MQQIGGEEGTVFYLEVCCEMPPTKIIFLTFTSSHLLILQLSLLSDVQRSTESVYLPTEHHMGLMKQLISTTETAGGCSKAVYLLCYVVDLTGGHMVLIERAANKSVHFLAVW